MSRGEMSGWNVQGWTDKGRNVQLPPAQLLWCLLNLLVDNNNCLHLNYDVTKHCTACRRKWWVIRRNRTFRPFVSSHLGRLNSFPAYSVKTHMIISGSTSILLTTARGAIFQCGARHSVSWHPLNYVDQLQWKCIVKYNAGPSCIQFNSILLFAGPHMAEHWKLLYIQL